MSSALHKKIRKKLEVSESFECRNLQRANYVITVETINITNNIYSLVYDSGIRAETIGKPEVSQQRAAALVINVHVLIDFWTL